MLTLSVAGRLGRDAVHRSTQNGKELCSFSIAADVGFGDNEQTIWVDVTRWGNGARRLTEILTKGTPVAVYGEMSTREHEGKTYIQCRADGVTLLGSRQDGNRSQSQGGGGGFSGGGGSYGDDLDDDVPFITSDPRADLSVF